MDEDTLVCDTCKNRLACESRQTTETWIYSDQFALCCDLQMPEYHDIDWWVCHECTGGKELSPEELELLHREEIDMQKEVNNG